MKPIAWFVGVGLVFAACRSEPKQGGGGTGNSTASSAPPSAPLAAAGAPGVAGGGSGGALTAVSKREAEKILNPEGLPPYTGAVGAVAGRVQATGDAPVRLQEVLSKLPAGKCPAAKTMYGQLFREGTLRTLADALVAVTGYNGYVPPRGNVTNVDAAGCAWDARTIALPFGHRLTVTNRGGETYLPQLVGAPTHALIVAMPGGRPVSLFPQKPGKYALIDKTHDFVYADVFVMNYSTFQVTGLDGQFEIRGIPAGEVTVSALLPMTGKTAEQRVTVRPGETARVNLEIPFDRKQDYEARRK